MNYSELKQLFEHFDDKEDVLKASLSIDKGYVTLEEVLQEDYFEHNEKYYSSDDYVLTNDGDLIHTDDSLYCEGIGGYVHIDDSVGVYEGRYETIYSLNYVRGNSNFIEFQGRYYDDNGRDVYGIVWIENLQEWGYADDNYWHEDDGEWYSYPDTNKDYTRGYHDGGFKTLTFNNKSKYRIGYEIEKEDYDVKTSIYISDFEDETDGYWRKERDGSLDNDSGFELISPTFEFDIDKIFEHIEGNNVLVEHINAKKSHSCGGHIHLSEKGLTGDELFEKVRGYTPLFYALYYGRVSKNYSKGKSNDDLKNENEKYQAIKIHHDRIEFRIISAVPNVSTLKWRSKLLIMILQHPTNDIIQAYYNVDTKFTKLLKQTYSEEGLVELKKRFVRFTREFEGIEIDTNKNKN